MTKTHTMTDDLRTIRRLILGALVVVILLGGIFYWATTDQNNQQNADRSASRHNFCLNQNAEAVRAIDAAVKTAEAKARDLIRISGTDPSSPVAQAFIQGQIDVTDAEYRHAFPLRSCTPEGEARWSKNPPSGPAATTCPSDEHGYCR